MSPRKGKPAVPLTEARKQLFQLVEELLTGRRDRVVLSHRGHEEQVVLVRARELEGMEADLAALRRLTGIEPRPLRGIATIVGDPETVVDEIRARQRVLHEAKMRDIFGDPPAPAPIVPRVPEAPGAPRRHSGVRSRKSTP